MNIDKLTLMSGAPVALADIGISINQPRLKDIGFLGEEKFYRSLSLFLINKDKMSIPVPMSDFDLFMHFVSNDQEIQQSVSDIFTLVIDELESIKFYDTFIIINALGHECIIDEPKFLIIKEALISIFCLSASSFSGDINPVNKKAQEIAEKLKRRKEQLAQDTGKQQEGIYSNLVSILTIGSNTLSLEDCLNLTIYQIQDLIKRFNLYEQYNKQIQALLQGAKDIELVEWTKQL
jgi:hypothetical protein